MVVKNSWTSSKLNILDFQVGVETSHMISEHTVIDVKLLRN